MFASNLGLYLQFSLAHIRLWLAAFIQGKCGLPKLPHMTQFFTFFDALDHAWSSQHLLLKLC